MHTFGPRFCPLASSPGKRSSSQSDRYRFLAYGVQPRDIEGEHQIIMQATLARDAEAAVKALSDHLALTADIILETFASRPAGHGG